MLTNIFRGDYRLPESSLRVQRDLDAETIAAHVGHLVHGYRMTAADLEADDDRSAGEYLLYVPCSHTRPWRRFDTAGLHAWMAAYDVTCDGEVPQPGQPFTLQLPSSRDGFAALSHHEAA